MNTKPVPPDRHSSLQDPYAQFPMCEDWAVEQFPTEAPDRTVRPADSMFFVVEPPAQPIPSPAVAPHPTAIPPRPAATIVRTARAVVREASVVVAAFMIGAVFMGAVATGPGTVGDEADTAAAAEPVRTRASASVAPADAVQDVILEYRRAVSNVDPSGLTRIWPTVDARTIEQAFSSKNAQTVDFERCDIVVNKTSADASCTGRVSYTDEQKLPHVEARRWHFTLRHAQQRWLIQSVVSTYSVEAALGRRTR